MTWVEKKERERRFEIAMILESVKYECVIRGFAKNEKSCVWEDNVWKKGRKVST